MTQQAYVWLASVELFTKSSYVECIRSVIGIGAGNGALILFDINLPGMNCFEVLKQLRNN